MARRKKCDNTTSKQVNPVGVRKSSRQIARKQSLDGNKINGDVLHTPEVHEVAPEPPKTPEVVVKRKRGRPPKNSIKQSNNSPEIINVESVLKNSPVEILKNSPANYLEKFPEEVLKNSRVEIEKKSPVKIEKISPAKIPENSPVKIFPEDNVKNSPAKIEVIDEENSRNSDMIVENSQLIPGESWTTGDIIEETIICETMEVDENSPDDTEYIEEDSNVVLEQVILMDEPNYEGKNIVYVIQNEDGTESMVMPTSDAPDGYEETNEYEVIEQGVECLSVDDSENSKNCEEIVNREITDNIGSPGEQPEPDNPANCVDEPEKMITEDTGVISEETGVISDDLSGSSNHLPLQPTGETPELPKSVDKVTKSLKIQDSLENSPELEDSSSNIDSHELPSENSIIVLEEDSEDTSNQVFTPLTPSPAPESSKIDEESLKTPEDSQTAEELSFSSEIATKIYPEDSKFSSSSENSNDTVSSKALEPPGQLDTDKKSFRSRSGSTDTTGSESGSNSSAVRRSSRIRSQGLMKPRSRGRGLVTKPISDINKSLQQTPGIRDTPDSQSETQSDKENTKQLPTDQNTPMTTPGYDSDTSKPVKVKSRWRRSSELEMCTNTSRLTLNLLSSTTESILPAVPENSVSSSSISSESESIICNNSPVPKTSIQNLAPGETDKEMEDRLSQFEVIHENLYLTERYTNKETKRMTCDCFLTDEEFERGEMGCGEDCLNRLLMIECGPRCNINDRCTNKRFQNCEYAKCEVFRTEKKGFGLRAIQDLQPGDFIMEYVGEVLDPKDFRKRAKDYSKDKNIHYYFMALKSDQIIDATMKGNISRFINHSCDPNAETQKWTVNGELRIGFFNRRFVAAGEEITFDYHFQRYGKEAQKCYCEASSCRGWIGDTPDEEKEKTEKSLAREEKREREDKGSNRKKREVKKLYMEDEDLEEEIDKLCSSGLKNRTHTLTLSRLMVRSREIDHRMRLLKFLQSGVEACRRLFLDYHGLRLIWSYMMDITGVSTEEGKRFKLELLKTLNTLPIPNKTMLMDSKVLGVVDDWSKDISSPKLLEPLEDHKVESKVDEVDNSCDSTDKIEKTLLIDEAAGESPVDSSPGVSGKVILEISSELLTKWSSLKEVFRIPKKERIEQMKEHEREADIGYNEDSEKEERRGSSGYERHRSSYERRIDRRRGRDSPENDYRVKDKERCNLVPVRRLSKYERRQLFAMRVAKEEEERMRRQQQEAFQHHEAKCIALGMDPMATPMFDSQTGYPMFFNPNIGQWQVYPLQEEVHNPVYMEQSPGGIHQNHQVMALGGPKSFDLACSKSFDLACPGQTGMTPDISPTVYGIAGVQYSSILGQVGFGENIGGLHNGVTPVYGERRGEDTGEGNSGILEGIEEGVQVEVPQPDLPPKWKCAKDSRGRYYYYHVKERISQWLPPPPTHIGGQLESSSSEESSEVTSSEEEEESEEGEGEDGGEEVEKSKGSRDPRTAGGVPDAKRRRDGLVQERIISPRREENRINHKKYKDIKDKLKRHKEKGKVKEHLEKMRKHRRANKAKSQAKHTANKLQAIAQSNELTAERKIKDSFRVNMATVIVKFLNPYRQNDCKQGRITNTEDFKYLARKLTHFVMAKELKHCKSVDELQCNDNVKHKAKDFVRKYMNKFGPIYQRSSDDD